MKTNILIHLLWFFRLHSTFYKPHYNLIVVYQKTAGEIKPKVVAHFLGKTS